MEDVFHEKPEHEASDAMLKKLLEVSRTIAVVGISTDPEKPSHRVPSYLQEKGYRIVPVNPKSETLLGERVYRSLEEIPFPVDLVEIFRPVAEIPGVVDAAMRVRAKAVWMQEGLTHEEAAEAARRAGLTVVQSRCMMVEYKRLIGG